MMVPPHGKIELHDMLPMDNQDSLTRLEGILDEMLKRHEYPEDVMEIVHARICQWVEKWHSQGVQKGKTFAQFQYDGLPGFVKEEMNIIQQTLARNNDEGGAMMPPGRRN